MKQRLVVASAFLHQPEVMVVDEPMVGLDPKGARLIKQVFREYCDSGHSVFVSTHTLEVAQELCDRIGIILRGELVALGTMEELKAKAETKGQDLEEIFLKLTGGEGFKESEAAL
jgi:ABC-2 type transport system ATP-binding protein